MAGGDIANMILGIPFLTRHWFCGTILFSLIGRFGLINPALLILVWDKFIYNLQIWRPISALLFYPVTPQTGLHFLINLYFLYSYSSRLESGSPFSSLMLFRNVFR
ncbi:unnamed protein product [Protopolystoma xenopodis]|uniref:Derlin n=1 Tax=Protopolystoma xenopodis TaxID=117903 RepID=A0A448X7L5_9PLAT|nr:unnamed protein product [Protopolystoma xenopodis]